MTDSYSEAPPLAERIRTFWDNTVQTALVLIIGLIVIAGASILFLLIRHQEQVEQRESKEAQEPQTLEEPQEQPEPQEGTVSEGGDTGSA